jgi:hypothetical protein
MHLSRAHNKDRLIRAIELMQCLLSPGEPPRFSSNTLSEYGLTEFMRDLQTCGEDEREIFAINAQVLFETAIQRKMPTLWLVKARHPVFAVYAALCESIKRPLDIAAVFLIETDFPNLTKYGRKLLRSPVYIVGIEEDTSLSSALKKLPPRKDSWTVLCNWRFDDWDTAVAEALEESGTACVLRPR